MGDRYIKIKAATSADAKKSRYSSGFIVRHGVAITSAHGVSGAGRLRITTASGQEQTWVDVTPDTVWSGDPNGPAENCPPDLALILCPELGPDLPSYPLGLLERRSPHPVELTPVHVRGFPASSVYGSVRGSFEDTGSISLGSDIQRGTVNIQLTKNPPPPQDRDESADQWSGLSGSPVIYQNRLVAIVTEHFPRLGEALISAIPLAMIDHHPEWPAAWGIGVPSPEKWWHRLGVSDPVRIPRFPPEPCVPQWLDDVLEVRRLVEDTAIATEFPDGPGLGWPQIEQVIAEALRATKGLQPANVLAEVRRLLSKGAADQPSTVLGVSLTAPLDQHNLSRTLQFVVSLHRTVAPFGQLSSRIRFCIRAPRIAIDHPSQACRRWLEGLDDADIADELIDRISFDDGLDDRGEALAVISNSDSMPCDPTRTTALLIDLVAEHRHIATDADSQAAVCFETQRNRLAAVVLTASDKEPDRTGLDEQGFPKSEQPTLRMLREGYFATAADLTAAESDYWNWQNQLQQSHDRRAIGRVPAFWIFGPSGAGKSIALLQLISRLNHRANVTALWVDGRSMNLAEATEQALAIGPDRHVIIGVDNPTMLPYENGMPALQAALGRLARLRQHDPARLPTFVCCSTTEQRVTLHKEYPHEFTIRQFIIDPYTAEYSSRLASWYQARTGRYVESRPANGPLLPVQMYFEWWKGEGIDAFAQRFRQRILSGGFDGLGDFFNRLLAVNRLEIGYPEDAVSTLPSHVRDGIAVLNADSHIALPSPARPGYWLAHPQLAELFYHNWFPEETCWNDRTDHLTGALLDAIGIDPKGLSALPLVKRLSDLAGDASPYLPRRTDSRQADAALAAGARAAASYAAELADIALSEWIAATGSASTADGTWAHAEAIDRLEKWDGGGSGVSMIATALAASDSGPGTSAVWDFLGRHPELPEWISIASTLLGNASAQPVGRVITEGAMHHRDDDGVIEVLSTSIGTAADDEVRPFCRRLLVGEIQCSQPLAPLAERLVSETGPFDPGVLKWLQASVRRENGTVFAKVMERPTVPAEVWQEITKWLIAYPAEKGAGAGFAIALGNPQRLSDQRFVGALKSHLHQLPTELNPRLYSAIVRHLESPRSGWITLFGALPDSLIADPAVTAAALSWLRSNPRHRSWSYIFPRLCGAAAGTADELIKLGFDRLPELDTLSAPPVLRAMLMVATPEAAPKIAGKCLQWLAGHDDADDAWGWLVRDAIPALPENRRDQACRDVLEWLREHQSRAASNYVLQTLVQRIAQPSCSPELADRVLDFTIGWLARDNPGWGDVFLLAAPMLVNDGADIAVTWLSRNYGTHRWTAVFGAVASRLDHAQIVDLTLGWFSHDGNPEATSYIWARVESKPEYRSLLSDQRIRAAMFGWLQDHGRLASWWHIWRDFVAYGPDCLPLLAIALRSDITIERAFGVGNLIRKQIDRNPELIESIWTVMADADPGETWQALCSVFMAAAPTNTAWDLCIRRLPELPDKSFSALWRQLWKMSGDRTRRQALRSLADEWLSRNPDEVHTRKVIDKLTADKPPVVTPLLMAQRIQPRAAEEPSHVPEVRCLNCASPLRIPSAYSPARRVFCWNCASAFTVDYVRSSLSPIGAYKFVPALRVVERTSKGKALFYVECPGCGESLRAEHRRPGAWAALDHACGLVHSIPDRTAGPKGP